MTASDIFTAIVGIGGTALVYATASAYVISAALSHLDQVF